MLLKTGNDQIRFKPRPIEGATLSAGTGAEVTAARRPAAADVADPGADRDGVVATKDSRGKKLERRYYVDIAMALCGEDRIDEAVRSVPGDGSIRSNFGKDVDLDLSDRGQGARGTATSRSVCSSPDRHAVTWLFELADMSLRSQFHARCRSSRRGPTTSRRSSSTRDQQVGRRDRFEKVNTGGLALNVFELLTATFAGDKAYFDEHGTDFRLNDDWQETEASSPRYPVLGGRRTPTSCRPSRCWRRASAIWPTAPEGTGDLGQARGRPQAHARGLPGVGRPPARGVPLGLDLPRRPAYLRRRASSPTRSSWCRSRRSGSCWAQTPTSSACPREADRMVLVRRSSASSTAARSRLASSATSSRSRPGRTADAECRDAAHGSGRQLRRVPAALVADARLRLPTRASTRCFSATARATGWKTRRWTRSSTSTLAVDIHHVFPAEVVRRQRNRRRAPRKHRQQDAARCRRQTGSSVEVAPVKYLASIEKRAGISEVALNDLLRTHLVDPDAMRSTELRRLLYDSEAGCPRTPH